MFSAIQPFERLAIVGMDVAWAGCDGLDAFERVTYEGGQQLASIEGGKTVAGPPECESLLSQVAQRALLDAGIEPHPSSRLAALAACGEPVAVNWPWAGRFADLSGQANPLAAAVEQAQLLLRSGEAEMVLFAASSNVLALDAGTPLAADSSSAMGFDREVHGWRFGQGAGAVVWMRFDQALREGRRIYAVVRSMAAAPSPAAGGTSAALPAAPALDDVRGCCREALAGAGITAGQVGYVEAFASGSDALDGIEIAGLVQAYRLPVQDFSTAIGSVQASLGYLGAASGLAGLIRAALCLYHRMIPAVPGWSAPKLPALWRGSPFYVPTESRAWFEKTTGLGRFAGVNGFGHGGSFAHLILDEGLINNQPRINNQAVEQPVRPNKALSGGGFYLFPFTGESLEDLLQGLESLQRDLAGITGIDALAGEYYAAGGRQQAAPYALAVVGHTQDELTREIAYALKAVPAAFEKQADWQTPLGSYFTALPVGQQGGVALVYPGAFNSYPGVGKDLLRLFPSLHQQAARVTTDLGRVIHERMLYPRSLSAISKEELAAYEARLLADPIAMLISGTTLAILYTHILQDTFQIRPTAAFGYSLGENSMLYATGVWQQGDQASNRLEESETFRLRLAGPQSAIRDYWGLPSHANGSSPALWNNYLVMAEPERVIPALANEPRVYLTHINTPRQVVIGGDPEACKRVLAALRCSSIQAPFDYALHCAVMRSEYDGLAELHSWPVEAVPPLRMYSAAGYAPLTIEPGPSAQQDISHRMAEMLTAPLDFPRLVRTVYEDGARVFIEAGAGGNCARWVDESLKGCPHLAISLNRRGTDDYSTLVRTLARLFSHRVPLDLSALYQTQMEKVGK